MTMYVWEEGLRETTREQDCFKFSLKNRETTVVWCALEVDSMPLDQNVKTPDLRRNVGGVLISLS